MFALLFACQEPFEAERHRLDGFRIAAVGVVDGVGRAALWSGEGLFHQEPSTLVWSLDGVEVGQGYGVAIKGDGLVELEVTDPQGQVHMATVTADAAPEPLALVQQGVSLPDLDLDARRQAQPQDAIETAARLTIPGLSETHTLRWMTHESTVLELESEVADVLAEEVVFEDGEVVSRVETGVDLSPGVVLALDGKGSNRWLWFDVAFEDPDPRIRVGGRSFAGEIEAPRIAATLEASGDQAGIRLADVVAVTDLSQQEPLACALAGVPFELDWIHEGRCLLEDVVGVRVVLDR